MQTIDTIQKYFNFSSEDQKNLTLLGEILLPASDQFADEFYNYLIQNRETASFFKSDEAIKRRKDTFKQWFEDLFTTQYDNRYLQRLQRIGKVHVKINLRSYFVDASMSFIRNMCRQRVAAHINDSAAQEELLATLHKALDINLSVITSSFQEEKFQKAFISERLESNIVNVAGRLLHGLNLALMLGLLILGVGVVSLLAHDIIYAFSGEFEYGVIKALGSLLLLWMMIELLHTEIEHLQGGKFQVRIFVEIALVAFIRKLFVASFKYDETIAFVLMLSGLLVLGIVYYIVAKMEQK